MKVSRVTGSRWTLISVTTGVLMGFACGDVGAEPVGLRPGRVVSGR
jgi:hypothetical protein